MQKLSSKDILRTVGSCAGGDDLAQATAVCHFAEEWLIAKIDKNFGKVLSWKHGYLRIAASNQAYAQQIHWQQLELEAALQVRWSKFKFKGIRIFVNTQTQ